METRSLHSAICEGDEHLVHSLVTSHAVLDDQNGSAGSSPLFLAAERGLSTIVRLLALAGANLDLGNFAGVTPLMKASWNGHVEAAEVLLEFEADVHLRDSTGATALYMASEYGHRPIVQRLLQAGAEVDAEDGMGAIPLFIAAENGFTDVMETLMLAGGNIDHVMWFSGLTAINTASWAGQIASVDLLINVCADVTIPNKRGFTPLCNASLKNRGEVVKRFIRAKADLNVANKAGETPIYVASKHGFVEIVSALITAKADVNIGSLTGSLPLHEAAKNGHVRIVELHVEAQAEVFAANDSGETALLLACSHLNEQVVKFLLHAMTAQPTTKSEIQKACLELMNSYRDHPTVLRIRSLLLDQSDTSYLQDTSAATFLSENCCQLSHRLSSAGFTTERAQFQAGIAHALEDICTRSLGLPHYLTGSYGDGWGNNLNFLNGQTGFDSDIDFTRLVPDCYHIAGCCRCPRESIADDLVGELVDGHVACTISSSVTAETCLPSRLRPATDYVFAIRCCCYPDVPVLQPGCQGYLSETLVENLLNEIRTGNPCHLIRASSPGKSGLEMRISTTFLERLFMRSLTTVQGQLFVSVKHLLKNVISRQVKGLKSYHAKTLIFLMVHRTPIEMWQPENLMLLIHQALNLLISCLSRETDPRVCMRHFFYPDAPLYFKKNSSPKDEVLTCLKAVVNSLPDQLNKFQLLLKTLESSDFYFHPFSLLPLQRVTRSPSVKWFSNNYHQLYDCIAQLLLRLRTDAVDSDESNWRLLDSLPDCAYTARECIRTMLQLKSGDTDTARQTLKDRLLLHKVNRSIKFKQSSILHQLFNSDSAWRFVFRIDEGLKLSYLPASTQKIFPQKLDAYFEFFYFNFDAALKSLCFELLPKNEVSAEDWFRELQRGPDLVELVTLAEFSRDPHHLEFAHEKLVAMSDGYDDVIAGVKEKLVQLLRKPCD